MTVRVRFAPSPTGHLHVGNLRTAIITWLFCRHNNGEFLLRIDDTDAERSKQEYVDSIFECMGWMGLTYDNTAKQSERWDRYNTVIADLKAQGRLYPCYETPEELNLKRKSLLSRGLPPIYDRAALNLTADEVAAYEAAGRKPHWRFKLIDKPIKWHDLVRGEVVFDGGVLSDPVLIREDGSPLYHLCSVIDDIDFKMTHIIRGEDHVSNTAFHLQMFEAIGATPPQLAHLPMITDPEGGKLSKRLGALNFYELRDLEGLEPMAISSLLSRLGTSDPIEACHSYEPLITSFSFEKFSRNAPKFDPDEILRLNAKLIHDMQFADIAPRLKAMGLGDVDEAFWLAVRTNLERVRDIADWWKVVQGPVSASFEQESDAEFVRGAAALMPQEPWDSNTWKQWTDALKTTTGRKGRELFMPLRKALTGMDHGPELAQLLPLLGYEKAKSRLA